MTTTHDGLLLVLSEPKMGAEDAFNRWYDEVHLDEVVALPGFVSAVRYQLASAQLPGRTLPAQRFLSLYSISGSVSEALDGLNSAVDAETIGFSTSLDRTSVRAWAYEMRNL